MAEPMPVALVTNLPNGEVEVGIARDDARTGAMRVF